VVDPEYARLNIGVSITRGNSGNGALPTRVLEQAENKGQVGQVTGPRASRPLSRNDRSVTIGLRPTLSNLDSGRLYRERPCNCICPRRPLFPSKQSLTRSSTPTGFADVVYSTTRLAAIKGQYGR
jgi:hypothetical protein